MLGKHDYEVPSVLAEQYFKLIDAPKKELIWFENSAHLANIEEPEKFNALLTKIIQRTDLDHTGVSETVVSL